jgi:hypothetical protein
VFVSAVSRRAMYGGSPWVVVLIDARATKLLPGTDKRTVFADREALVGQKPLLSRLSRMDSSKLFLKGAGASVAIGSSGGTRNGRRCFRPVSQMSPVIVLSALGAPGGLAGVR